MTWTNDPPPPPRPKPAVLVRVPKRRSAARLSKVLHRRLMRGHAAEIERQAAKARKLIEQGVEPFDIARIVRELGEQAADTREAIAYAALGGPPVFTKNGKLIPGSLIYVTPRP